MSIISRVRGVVSDSLAYMLGTHTPSIPAIDRLGMDSSTSTVIPLNINYKIRPSPENPFTAQPQLEALAQTIIDNRSKGETSMATTPAQPQTFLQKLGTALKTILRIGEEAAVVAEPIVIAAFPTIAPIYTSAIGLAVSAEATATAATGTGTAKLADVVSKLTPMAEQFAQQNGLTFDASKVEKWASAIADSLNLAPFGTK